MDVAAVMPVSVSFGPALAASTGTGTGTLQSFPDLSVASGIQDQLSLSSTSTGTVQATPAAAPEAPQTVADPSADLDSGAASARIAYRDAAASATSEALAANGEAEDQVRLLIPASPALPGPLAASLQMASFGPGSAAILLSGGLVGYWPSPTPELAEALAAILANNRQPEDIHRPEAPAPSAQTSDPFRRSNDGELALAAYLHQGQPEPEVPAGRLNLLD